YLTHKAQQVGYHPNMILAGRRLNDNMGQYIASSVIKLMINKKIDASKAKILVLGITFKENCPDLRNTKVIDIINELDDYGLDVAVYDPWASKDAAKREYGVQMTEALEEHCYDGVILAVAHKEFVAMTLEDMRFLCKPEHIIFDVKGILPPNLVDGSL
ncbi:MAG TPA: UDP binding domain-containing protein, partial [Desulfopila sp.]|nr:UDP binding domain-containing protein [Desulfopila sp.]